MTEHLLTQTELIARLRMIRRACGMTQQDLADAAGMTRTRLVKLENGNYQSLSIDEATALTRAMNVDLTACLRSEPIELPSRVIYGA